MQTTSTSNSIEDQALERQGKRHGRAGGGWLVAGIAAALPGIVMVIVGFVVGIAWMWAVGLAVIALAGIPLAIGLGLISSSVVSRWSARHKSFA